MLHLVTRAVSQVSRPTTLLLLKRPASTLTATSTTTPQPVSLSNIEASWKTLTPAEQESTFKSLEELQKKDWNELSLDEKKASYYVAFGPHGPREPILAPGGGAKTAGGIIISIALASLMFYGVRQLGSEKPRTITKEWQEASNERAIEQKQDPFTGSSSPGYDGKGKVTQA